MNLPEPFVLLLKDPTLYLILIFFLLSWFSPKKKKSAIVICCCEIEDNKHRERVIKRLMKQDETDVNENENKEEKEKVVKKD